MTHIIVRVFITGCEEAGCLEECSRILGALLVGYVRTKQRKALGNRKSKSIQNQ